MAPAPQPGNAHQAARPHSASNAPVSSINEWSRTTMFSVDSTNTSLTEDRAFNIATKFLTGVIRLDVEEEHFEVLIDSGIFIKFSQVDADHPADIVFSGSREAWTNVLARKRPPGYQGILYNDGRSGISYTADTVTMGAFSRAILEMERVLRDEFTGRQQVAIPHEVDRDFDASVGRYVYLRVQGVQYRVYFEESGTGSVPLLFQHSAGADGRQARRFLEDPEMQKRFRMISYDLPFHGKSLPPESQRWWETEFKLTREFLLEFILGLCSKLDIDRAAFIGSAIGGLLALDLAYFHPDTFRAVIALNASSKPYFEEKHRDKLSTYSDPRIGNQWTSSQMVANMASTTPEADRREGGWVYSQAGQDATEGALNYYANSYDLSASQIAAIDTSKTSVYLFTGEDDFMGTEYGTDSLAAEVPGLRYEKLRHLGHFGVAENAPQLKEDLWPTLLEICASPRFA
ncbi:alpha/beta fold hydrolase [Gordonia sp. LSe1-13]|uniref:Alpha/beta fold hydrolase n=1 Tax=Gordonia sesuvii TaxID=3116777 RepID=A0ABU7M969_9ACTN|nr:alpha/beta fold hydrolase [Gordonia sp. LSe1-13]